MSQGPRGTVALLAETHTVHHDRFLAALRDGGWRAELVPVDVDAADAAELLVAALADLAPAVVLAGPLPGAAALAVAAAEVLDGRDDTVRPAVVVASWGSDLLHDVEVDPIARERATRALRAADAVLVDCRTVQAAAVALGAVPDRIVRFPWGVDLAAHPYTVPSGVVGQSLRVLSLRSLAPTYRIDTLLDALVSLPTITCTIAGDGPAASSLRARAVELGVDGRITWVGRVSEPEVVALLAAHDVHVSTAPVDGASISLLQAMAVGCPSVVVDNPSNREWLEEGRTGWLVPAGDAVRLADVLAEVDGRRALLPLVARSAREVVEQHADWLQNRQRLWSLLDRVQPGIERPSRTARPHSDTAEAADDEAAGWS
jgi:glycosyltransferase involved in cell wall biosynthesis